MKFNEQWLREWVNPAVDTQTLSHQLTMLGLEVDAIEPVAAAFSGVVVGEVLSVEPHPDADKLRVCRVNVGEAEALQIVCGAANVAAGMRVPAALIGAELPGLKIKKSKLRGVESFGMLCSAAELGLAESASGLLPLPVDAAPGTCIREYLKLDDVAIEIGLTPNRADCLSVAGIAREAAVVNKMPLQALNVSPVAPTIDERFSVSVEVSTACPRYLGRVIKGINAQAETPLWMRERLRRCGLRSISPTVDVTNYVLLELGQPMHAFDLNKLSGGIQVRMAQQGETLKLLDGQDVTLNAETLVIADANGPVAMAGIMGGDESAVADDTTNIFLESAFFAPLAIVGKARGYGLHTDSSHRFERGVDPELAPKAMERATQLLLEIVGGAAGPVVEVCHHEALPARPSIRLRRERIQRLLGFDAPAQDVRDMLASLQMKVEETADGWQVVPPSFRFDIEIEADLIEEIGRIYGYTQLPTELPVANLRVNLPQEALVDDSAMRKIMTQRGYLEAITYSFVDPGLQALIEPEQKAINLANPISADMSQMRTSLWPGLLQAVSYNYKRQQSRVRLFEIGLKYSLQQNEIKEKNFIAGVITGAVAPEQWGQPTAKADFFDVKADVEALLDVTARRQAFEFRAATHPALHPGQCADIIAPGGETIGRIGALHPSIQLKLGIKQPVFIFEIAVNELRAARLPKFESMSKFPAIRRDLALVVDNEVSAQRVQATIRDVAGDCLTNLQLFDVYSGEGVESGRKSLALGLTFQDSSRTLTDEEIEGMLETILSQLNQKLNASLR